MNTTTRLGLLGILHFTFCIFNCSAELTATVYPGYTLSANERPTTAILNLLARPSVTVSGTLGGTNVGLAANSVSGAMLMTSVVDDDTIEFFNNGGSTAIRLKAYNTGTNAIDANLAGLGLGGGDGFALSNKTDNVSITITNDVLTLMTNLSVTHLNVTSNSVVVGSTNNQAQVITIPSLYTNMLAQVPTFASSPLSMSSVSAAGIYLNVAHGQNRTPPVVTLVLVCTTADLNYSIGDEAHVTFPFATQVITFGNTTNVGFICNAAASSWTVCDKSTGTATAITPARWSAKIYARP